MKHKKRKCKICPTRFYPSNSFHTTCSPACAIAKTEQDKNKASKKLAAANREKAKIERQLNRAAKDRLKTLSDWLGEAQKECNKYIRKRDEGKPCISCGKIKNSKHDAGHYRTVANCKELRFHPMNIHRQCSWDCNKNKSGNIIEYRKNLVKLIGVDNVEWIENHHDYYTWTIEDAKEIKEHYKQLIKED